MLKKLLLACVVAVVAMSVIGCVSKPYRYLDISAISDGGEPNNCGKDGTAGSCKTVFIGNQTWMAENLNREVGNSWCYGNVDSLCDKFGRLYNSETAKKACPDGYHLPSRVEWTDLEATAGGSSVAGKSLKSTKFWYKKGAGTDNYGFSALPGGYLHDGNKGVFTRAGVDGYWWTAEDSRAMLHWFDGVDKLPRFLGHSSPFGYSVRCVQDNNCGKDGTISSCKTVVIGNQTWMAENLNREMGNSWCYDDNNANCHRFGRLYDFKTAAEACPAGYHLPSRDEWNVLATTVGGFEMAAKILKSKNGWSKKDTATDFAALATRYHDSAMLANDLASSLLYSSKSTEATLRSYMDKGPGIANAIGTDDYGFSALPGGIRQPTGTSFAEAGYFGVWWTATEEGHDDAYGKGMFWYGTNIYEEVNDKKHGFSVRCIQD